MNKEINKIIDNLEGCIGMFDYLLTPVENNLLVSYIKELQQENEKLKEKNTIYKYTIKGQHKKIEELKNAKRISKKVHKERKRRLQEENEQLKKDKKFYANAFVNLRNRNDKAIEVIDTQMKLAEDGVKENLRIIKFYLIKGECSVYDLTTEEDYKYKVNNNE